MINSILMMGGLGVVVGIILAAASKIFYVYVDPLVEKIDDALPGANCGGCGLPGCSANAEAIAKGQAGPDSCVAGGSDLAAQIAELLGVSVEAKEADIALPGCTYGTDSAELKFIYQGIDDCRAASLIHGGIKECETGCLGYGSCYKACMFGAITMQENGIPLINEEKCTGCGSCEKVCPKNIIKLSSVTRRILYEYTTDDCTTPCQRSCPAGINISQYVGQIAEKNFTGALQTIKERNPFPAVIGRICPRPCENSCRRNLTDEPVAINYLKRFTADYEKESGEKIQPYKAPETNKKIAVAGGGVEGLSAAYFLARLGHSPTVYEATDRVGGLLNVAISKNRLPDETLNYDIDGIRDMGVEIETEKSLGRDFTVHSLLSEGFEGVFTATGGWDNRLQRGGNSDIESVIPGTYLLIDLIKHGANVSCGKRIAVTGCYNLPDKAVEELKQKGAEEITLVYRETKENCSVDPVKLEKAMELGATVEYGQSVVSLHGKQENLESVRLYEFDHDRFQSIHADNLILASGRFPDLIFTPDYSEEEEKTTYSDTWKGCETYKYHEKAGLLSNGDELSDFTAAIKAINAGRKGAAAIHRAIYKLDDITDDIVIRPFSVIQNIHTTEKVKKVPDKSCLCLKLMRHPQMIWKKDMTRKLQFRKLKDA